MSSKRIAAKEWKRQRKQQQLVFRASIVGVVILILLGIGYIGWDLWSRTYVMTFAGERISTDELRFFSILLMFQQENATEFIDIPTTALEQLTQTLLIHREAANNGLVLTDEQLNLAEETATNVAFMIDNVDGINMPNISHERIVEIMSTDFLAEQLRDIYAADFVVDETEFNTVFADFLEANRGNFVEMEFKMYQFAYLDTAIDVWQRLADTDPVMFDTVFQGAVLAETGDSISEVDIPTFSIMELRPVPELEPYIAEFEAMAVGDFSSPITIDEQTYLIFVLDYLYEYSDEEIEYMFREEYDLSNRNRIFLEQLEEWRNTANIQINQRGVNAA
ncbi:MAG: hypothetical protein FWG64_09760 [Firmicutes bacterium]|nr:hypothetical protein [Bacillota bacterium]